MTRHPILDINRGERILFTFNGIDITAYKGETIAAALYASGVRIFSRSFKYHRPRGLFCMSGHCSNCLMRVDGVPNVRICREPVRPGAVVTSQNAWPSLKFDLAAMTGYLAFFVRPGFQYRRLIRARWAYHKWEKFLRRMAGIGTLADIKPGPPAKRRTAAPEIVVVGGGIAGLSAALHAAQNASDVWIIEREDRLGGRGLYDTSLIQAPENQTRMYRFEHTNKLVQKVENLENCRILKNAAAFAWYDEGILAVSQSGMLWELKPSRVIITTGSYEHPIVFENNDLPGIFSAGALQRLMHCYHIRPGRLAAVIACDEQGYAIAGQLSDAGVKLAGIVDNRCEEEVFALPEVQSLIKKGIAVFPGYKIIAATGRRQVKGITIESLNSSHGNNPKKKVKLRCDTLCIAGARIPANELVFQRTCEGVYILESPNQFARRPTTTPEMRAGADMFVAGGAAASRSMTRAYLEGMIAGLSAAIDLGYGDGETKARRDDSIRLMGNDLKNNGPY